MAAALPNNGVRRARGNICQSSDKESLKPANLKRFCVLASVFTVDQQSIA